MEDVAAEEKGTRWRHSLGFHLLWGRSPAPDGDRTAPEWEMEEWRRVPRLDPCFGAEGSRGVLFRLGKQAVRQEAGGRGQGQCLKGPPCPAKGISGPELTRLFGFVQLLRVLDVRPGVSHWAPADISFLIWSVGLIIGSRPQNCCEGYMRQRAFN